MYLAETTTVSVDNCYIIWLVNVILFLEWISAIQKIVKNDHINVCNRKFCYMIPQYQHANDAQNVTAGCSSTEKSCNE